MKKDESIIKLSIIIPLYNCEKFIEKCINSIITQETNLNYEIIIINDGSTDESLEKVENIKRSNSKKNIKIYSQKNLGVSSARNYGISLSKGKYVTFIDSDDFLEKSYLEFLNNIIENNNYELINFGFFSDVMDKNQKIISSDIINYKEKKYNSSNEIKKDLVALNDATMLYNIWNKIYLKEIIEKNHILFDNMYFGEDIIFNREYLAYTNKFYNSDKCFYHYIREREGAVTKRYKTGFFELRKKEFEDYNIYFEKNGIPKNEYYEFTCRRYIERILGCIENIYCSDMKFNERYSEIKKIILDSVTRNALEECKPKSNKIRIMILPIKCKMVLLSMLMGKMLHKIKNDFPALFNKLKNRR